MSYLKSSWTKEKKTDIPLDVMNHIAARGSFVVVKCSSLFREISDVHGSSSYEDGTGLSISDQLNNKIKEINFKTWMENIANNIPYIQKCKDISSIEKTRGKTAIVIGAGPSFREKRHVNLLKEIDNTKFTIISTDRMFIPLLQEGIVPDYVVSADGHPELITPFYQSDLISPDLRTRAIMATIVAPKVIQAFPGNIFFFTPMIDDIDQPFSLSEALSLMTRTSIIATGGNVGITSIFIAYFLGFQTIILAGMDQGYTMDTPIEHSQYYPVVKEADPSMTPERYKQSYIIEGFNPDFNIHYYTDITWKEHISHLVAESIRMEKAGTSIINCTEGGALHGGSIRSMTFKEALEYYG